MKTLITIMELERSTKNKYLYVAMKGEPKAVGSVYILKDALDSVPPPRIMVTIEGESE